MISASHIANLALALSCAGASGTFSGDSREQEASLLTMEEAKTAFKQSRWQEALDAAAEVLETQPDSLDALYIAGTSERLTNRIDEAQGHLRTLVAASPRYPLGHFQLGFTLFLEADSLQQRGQAELASTKYEESAREFAEELSRDPTHIDSLSSRAIALARAGKIEESLEAHEAWIASAPRKNAPVVSLAATYAVAGRSSDAKGALDRLPNTSGVSVSPAALSVAKVFAARRDWDAALPFFERAAEIDPASVEARARLTECYAQAAMANDAAQSLQMLLKMDPTPEQAERVGEAIKSTLGDGERAPSIPGVDPPAVVRMHAPRYPERGMNVETVVRIMARVRQDGVVTDTVLVPNRIWKDIRESGFEAAAVDAIRRGKFVAGTKDGELATQWLVVAVKFEGA